MKQQYVWIVEMLDNGKWLPTVGCRLTITDGRKAMEAWKQRNLSDKFRLTRYVPKNDYPGWRVAMAALTTAQKRYE